MNTIPHKKQGKLFVISAPSGAGKTTVSQAVLNNCQKNIILKKVITYTTRTPRPGEISGKDYYFLSRDEFKRYESQGFFLETTEYAGNYYGSPTSILDDLARGISYLMVTDRPGALVIKKLVPDALLIWISIPSIETLRSRLENRKTDLPDVIEKRLLLAQQEIDQESQEQCFDAHIINENFEQTVNQVLQIILDNR